MENADRKLVELYIPRKCSATNRLITAKDHASVQINIGHVNSEGCYTGEQTTFAFCGFLRNNAQSDEALNRLAQQKGFLKSSLPTCLIIIDVLQHVKENNIYKSSYIIHILSVLLLLIQIMSGGGAQEEEHTSQQHQQPQQYQQYQQLQQQYQLIDDSILCSDHGIPCQVIEPSRDGLFKDSTIFICPIKECHYSLMFNNLQQQQQSQPSQPSTTSQPSQPTYQTTFGQPSQIYFEEEELNVVKQEQQEQVKQEELKQEITTTTTTTTTTNGHTLNYNFYDNNNVVKKEEVVVKQEDHDDTSNVSLSFHDDRIFEISSDDDEENVKVKKQEHLAIDLDNDDDDSDYLSQQPSSQSQQQKKIFTPTPPIYQDKVIDLDNHIDIPNQISTTTTSNHINTSTTTSTTTATTSHIIDIEPIISHSISTTKKTICRMGGDILVDFQLIDHDLVGTTYIVPHAKGTRKIISLMLEFGARADRDQIYVMPLGQYHQMRAKIVQERIIMDQVQISYIPNNVFSFIDRHQQQQHETSEISKKDLEKRIPKALLDSLLPFQARGVLFGVQHNGRCMIGDEMGLGKTIQALGIASYFRSYWPLLIICPSSLRHNWSKEVQRWFRSDITQQDISIMMSGDNSADQLVNIVSYDLVTRVYKKKLANQHFRAIICDESHYLKNVDAKRTSAVLSLVQSATIRILLTGTPALSRPIELYPQLAALDAPIFDKQEDFGKRYCAGVKGRYGWDFSGNSHLAELHYLLRSVMIRRHKHSVLRELPPKHRSQVVVDVPRDHQLLYEQKAALVFSRSNKESMVRKGAAGENERAHVMDLYLLTGQAKLAAAKSYTTQLILENKKFLLFAHHSDVLNGLEQEIRSHQISYIRIDGSTPPAVREANVTRFQNQPKCQVALLSITAAGTGLTLTASSLVVFAELYWTPGVLRQAEDRVHRIGQKNEVNIHYLIGKGTLDDRIWPMICNKLEVIGETLDGQEEKLLTNHLDLRGALEMNEIVNNTKIETIKPFNNVNINNYFNFNNNNNNNNTGQQQQLQLQRQNQQQLQIQQKQPIQTVIDVDDDETFFTLIGDDPSMSSFYQLMKESQTEKYQDLDDDGEDERLESKQPSKKKGTLLFKDHNNNASSIDNKNYNQNNNNGENNSNNNSFVYSINNNNHFNNNHVNPYQNLNNHINQYNNQNNNNTNIYKQLIQQPAPSTKPPTKSSHKSSSKIVSYINLDEEEEIEEESNNNNNNNIYNTNRNNNNNNNNKSNILSSILPSNINHNSNSNGNNSGRFSTNIPPTYFNNQESPTKKKLVMIQPSTILSSSKQQSYHSNSLFGHSNNINNGTYEHK
ncbi:SNF2-related domain-containing protein [Cavenderia fasciculata]|uniref:SNF2-related domain-containing protein n=1 Tax=Cavenderia fasciculata TaxID=261658 RepID=F4PVF7_CACFS|nr:SNF2-related domain-containing protein [Cavenderia fasciculata]EGG19971.1 SNF2-related domain-containing protein [Cavenderia fasciculata]|eukprot:XP_004366954.1 SNF2-related domain-containing protein [Cavenderia fasciculata]